LRAVADEGILAEQIAYYRARAPEYDEWVLRQGRYDHGEEHRRRWIDELTTIEAALAEAGPAGDVLELACGTGVWTQSLAARAARLTAVDASPEVIALNRARVQNASVRYVEADLFSWQPREQYDFVFFAFWLSHVPEERFDAFWALVRAALRPSGKVFFADSLAAPEGTASDQTLESGGTMERCLNDGRSFRIVKVFHEPPRLAARLRALGWNAEVKATPTFFLHGSAW
jgi:2-polyprenyl-3-methyl-5-hydroxy-6-metoxy-1,4-benzoquinol methylase